MEISFRGNNAGVCEPTELSYSLNNLTSKGKIVMTTNQLEVECQKKTNNLKPMKGQYQ